jgi:hypothetical protein
MTPAAKATYSLALLIGLSLGVFFGFHWTMPSLERLYSSRQGLAALVLQDFSYMQYKHADYDHAKAALQTCASFSEELENLKSGEGTQMRDLAFTYTRLALLEDAANNPEMSRAYMSKARFWFMAAGHRASSDSELKHNVETWDAMTERFRR